jgi:hypothetical protein
MCVSLWLREILKLVDEYRSICTTSVGKGDTLLFSNDRRNGMYPAKDFPRLHSFALDSSLSVKEVIQCEGRSRLFYLPLPSQVFDEFNRMHECLRSMMENYLE